MNAIYIMSGLVAAACITVTLSSRLLDGMQDSLVAMERRYAEWRKRRHRRWLKESAVTFTWPRRAP